MFIITMAVSWTLTLMYNPNVLASNRLKDMVGYNNLCVGFDTEPARTVATPLFALMAYFGIRYVALDGVAADMPSELSFGCPSIALCAWSALCSHLIALHRASPQASSPRCARAITGRPSASRRG